MKKADFQTREKISHLFVSVVNLYPKKAVVKGNIPVISVDVISLTAASVRGICRKDSISLQFRLTRRVAGY